MATPEPSEEAVEALQQLGLREYESECFVGLTHLSTATAKEISEVTDVPRTRVYDAVRVLEARGLIAVQHSSPKRFRPVRIEEAVRTFRERYERNLDRLANALEAISNAGGETDVEDRKVWTVSGREAIDDRIRRLVDDASDEVVVGLGRRTVLTEGCLEALERVAEGVTLIVAAATETVRSRIEEALPRAETVVSEHEWLCEVDDEGRSIGRLLLVDRSAALLTTIHPESDEEHAIVGSGVENGLVVVARRLLARENRSATDTGTSTTGSEVPASESDGTSSEPGGTNGKPEGTGSEREQ
jgi:sugar-specific transcriptional regulator TrmB